jgi:hypothetical protein
VRVVDALRRAEAWDDAAATAEGLARTEPPEAVAQVIALERRLIEAQDPGRHTVATALPPPSRRPHVTHQRLGGAKPAAGSGARSGGCSAGAEGRLPCGEEVSMRRYSIT